MIFKDSEHEKTVLLYLLVLLCVILVCIFTVLGYV